MEKDFILASKKFWQTVQQLQKGKLGTAQSVLCWQRQLLSWTRDVIGQWKVLNTAKTFLGKRQCVKTWVKACSYPLQRSLR